MNISASVTRWSVALPQVGAGCGVATCIALLASEDALSALAAMQAAKIVGNIGIPNSNLEALKIKLSVRASQTKKKSPRGK